LIVTVRTPGSSGCRGLRRVVMKTVYVVIVSSKGKWDKPVGVRFAREKEAKKYAQARRNCGFSAVYLGPFIDGPKTKRDGKRW
jgi:hypothetical protein